jgi:hypothetical protein
MEALSSAFRWDLIPMIRFLLRFLGLWILAAGFVFLVYDGTKSIAGNAIYITRLADSWNAVHSASLTNVQPFIEAHLGTWLWENVAQSILHAPTWTVFGVLGGLFILLGRRKKPLIGYARS